MSSVGVINTSSLLYLALIKSLSRNCEISYGYQLDNIKSRSRVSSGFHSAFVYIHSTHQLVFDYTSPKLYHGFTLTSSRTHHASYFGSPTTKNQPQY